MVADDRLPARWAKVLDQTKCIGCHACTTACRSENEVPVGVTRTYVKAVDVGVFPQARQAFQVTRCNQCADAPCVAACPTGAMFRREDGIVGRGWLPGRRNRSDATQVTVVWRIQCGDRL